jgi:hypothetical protein
MKYKFFFLSIVLFFVINHVSAQVGSAVNYLKNDSILHVFINSVSQRALLDPHGQGIPYRAIDSLLTPDSAIAYQLQGFIPKLRIERRVNIYFVDFSLMFPAQKVTSKINTMIPPLDLSDVNVESDTSIQFKDPLENKNYGIEINPIWLLASIPGLHLIIDGGFSLFNVDRKAEITFQIGYSSSKGSPSILSHLDLIYRHFEGKYQGGFYISGGIRYMYIHAKRLEERRPDLLLKYYTNRNVGVMIGFGFRHFSHSGFYYGFGFELGTYFLNHDSMLEGAGFADIGMIVDIDILKIGFAF